MTTDPESPLMGERRRPPRRVRQRIETLLRVGCLLGDATTQAWLEYEYGDLGGWPRWWRKRRGLPVNAR